MKKSRLDYRMIRRIPVAGAAFAAALVLLSSGPTEAEAQPDPDVVVRYLEEIEARQALASGEAKRKDGDEKRIKNLIEGAAVRTPSEAAINRLETVVAS